MVAVSEPNGIGDLVFPTDAARKAGEGFVKEKLSWLLLHGAYGSGKSSAALALMKSRIPDLNPDSDIISMNASDVRTLVDIGNAFEGVRYSGFNTSGLKVLIIDEVDGLAPSAASAVKGKLDRLEGLNIPIIMTTNYVGKLDGGLVDRMCSVHWPRLEGVMYFCGAWV